MSFPREKIPTITAPGLLLLLSATFLPATLSPVPEIAAVLACYLIPAAIMLVLYQKVMEITGSPWTWFHVNPRPPDPARPGSALVTEANRYLACWCLTVECGGLVIAVSLFIPLFTHPVVILLSLGVFLSSLIRIERRFRQVADRIDPAFMDIWTGGVLTGNIFTATYFLAFVCVGLAAMFLSTVIAPVIAGALPDSPLPAVLGFRFYFLCLALFSAPGFVWMTIRR